MRKLVLAGIGCAACVWAADFWVSKSYTDWSTKDIQKLMSDSPWARRVDVPLNVRMPQGTTQSEGRGGRTRGGTSGDIATADGGQASGPDLTGTRSGPAGAGAGLGNDGPQTQTMPVLLVWQTALPVKQALAKAKFGAEAATSAEAKVYLQREEPFMVLSVEGLPATAAQAGEGDHKAGLLMLTALSVKGKDPLKAEEVQFNQRDRLVDAAFFFRRSEPGAAPFSVDDKELEFSTKFDKLSIKYRFKLKDMVYHGKLEL